MWLHTECNPKRFVQCYCLNMKSYLNRIDNHAHNDNTDEAQIMIKTSRKVMCKQTTFPFKKVYMCQAKCLENNIHVEGSKKLAGALNSWCVSHNVTHDLFMREQRCWTFIHIYIYKDMCIKWIIQHDWIMFVREWISNDIIDLQLFNKI